MESSFEYINEKLHRRRGKCDIFSHQKDVYVKVKQQKGTINHQSQMENETENSFNISIDIWYHISKHIEPGDVQRFALICKKTASLVNTKAFWRNMYKCYCGKKSSFGVMNLAHTSHLQWQQVINSKLSELRMNVIKALFFYYRPFNDRCEQGYSLDCLLERTCVATWQKQSDCIWITCFKFWNHLKVHDKKKSVESSDKNTIVALEDEEDVVDNWESLTTSTTTSKYKSQAVVHPKEGFSVLTISSTSFVPIPSQLTYQDSRYRLKATRRLLSSDMRVLNLELDFADSNTNDGLIITVKYPNAQFCKMIPWYHPYYDRIANY